MLVENIAYYHPGSSFYARVPIRALTLLRRSARGVGLRGLLQNRRWMRTRVCIARVIVRGCDNTVLLPWHLCLSVI